MPPAVASCNRARLPADETLQVISSRFPEPFGRPVAKRLTPPADESDVTAILEHAPAEASPARVTDPEADTFQAITFKSPDAVRTGVTTPANPDGLEITTSLSGPPSASPARWTLPS